MAEKLESFDFGGHGGRRATYPWGEWLDGSIWKLTLGVDFSGSLNSFRNNIYVTARRKGRGVRLRIVEGAIVLQAFERKQPA
jgi:hypothetical protein